MTALRIGNSKDALLQGMGLLKEILQTLGKPDALKTLTSAISMTEDELAASNEARSYVERSTKLRAEIEADRQTADKMMADAKNLIQEAKTAQINSKQTLINAEQRLCGITEKHNKKDAEHRAKDVELQVYSKRLEEKEYMLSQQAEKQDAKQKQLDELESKLRDKASKAAELMKGM